MTSLRIQLDDQLLLRRDRDIWKPRTLERPAPKRPPVNSEPRERRTARRLIHRRQQRHHLARLLTNLHLFTRRNHIARNVHALAVDLDVAVPKELTRSLAARRETHAV